MTQQDNLFSDIVSSLYEEGKINNEDQLSYFRYHKLHKLKKITEKTLNQAEQNLFNNKTSIVEKKHILFNLAHTKTPESFKILNQYSKNPDEALKGWAILAKEECRLGLEDYLLDKERGMVMSNLGGDGKRSRYYFIISLQKGIPLSKYQKDIIKDSFSKISKEKDSIVEKIKFDNNYALVKILISMDVAPGELIEEGINECNSFKPFVKFHYFITNTEKPDERTIKDYLKSLN